LSYLLTSDRPPMRVYFQPIRRPHRSTLFPYTTLFRSRRAKSRIAPSSANETTAPSAPASSIASTLSAATRGITRSSRPVQKEPRSEEHTSELQSRGHLVCRLLLEKKNIMHQAALGDSH